MNWKDFLNGKICQIKHAFDWTPVAVKAPCRRCEVYKDVGRVLLGYEVEVTYLYHGTKKRLFTTDEDKACIVSRKRALRNAMEFYKTTKERVIEYKKGRQQ